MNIRAYFFSSRGFVARLVTGIVLLNLLVIGLAGLAAYEDRREHEARARVAVENISLLLERDISAVFDRIDLGLHTAADEIEKQLATGAVDEERLNAFLKDHQAHLPEVISLRVTDADGMVRYGEGVKSEAMVSLSDREFFVLPRGNPKAGLVIAKPVKARISQTWVIPVSRRLSRPGGEFAGVVYVNLPVAHFVKKFDALKLGVHGLAALRSTDHISMARYPEAREGGGVVGQFAISDQLRSLLQNNPERVTYVAPSPSDHVERTFAYSKLAAYPLYVVVGLATQDVVNEWRRDSAQMGAMVLAFSLMTVAFGWLVSRSWRRQVRMGEALRESEQRWSFALDSGEFSVWDWDLVSDQVVLSKLGKQMFGFAETEMGDRMADWAVRCHPDDMDRVLAGMKDHWRGRTKSFVCEFRVRCKDASWKWILTRGLVVERATDGRPLRMIGTHVDITERRQQEDALRQSAVVFDMADEAMVVTNAQNEIISVNPAFTTITGYDLQDVKGRNPRLLSAKTHSRSFYEGMWERMLTTGGWSGEVLNRRKNGEVYTEWLSIKRVLDQRGQLTNYVAVFSDITARKASEGRMRHLALHDALTDLPNRALLTERLGQALVRARRNRTRLGLMYFDLDKFKPVNDTLGHEVGDLLLKAVAGRAVECVRESDTVARVGGDEFVVLLSVVEGETDALMVAEKIRVAMVRPFEIKGQALEISASIGLALYPEHGVDEQTLARHADEAMYQSKKDGRNRVTLYRADA